MATDKLNNWKTTGAWGNAASYSYPSSAKAASGYATGDVVPSSEHNSLFHDATLLIQQLQTSGIIFYNSDVSLPAGAWFAVKLSDSEVAIRRTLAVQNAGFDPDPSTNPYIVPAGYVTDQQVTQTAVTSSSIWSPATGFSTLHDALQALFNRTAYLYNKAGANIPVGMIVPFAGSTAPSGWIKLAESATILSTASYPALFAYLGTKYGGNGTSTFGIPGIKEGYALLAASASTYGAETVGEVISHTHEVTPTGVSGINAVSGGAGLTGGSTSASTIAISETGGDANLAAGSKFILCIKAFDILNGTGSGTLAESYFYPQPIQFVDVDGSYLDLDFSQGTIFQIDALTSDKTVAYSNVPSLLVSPMAERFTIHFTAGTGGYAITWPEDWTWASSSDLATSGTVIIEGLLNSDGSAVLTTMSTSGAAAVIDDANVTAYSAYSSQKIEAITGAKVVGIVTVTDDDYTLATAGVYVAMDVSGAQVVNVPHSDNLSLASWPIGYLLTFRLVGAGSFTITPETDVTVTGNSLVIETQNSTVQLLRRAENTWDLIGAEAVA